MKDRFRDLSEAFRASTRGKMLLLTFFAGFTAYSLMVLVSFPSSSAQLIGRSLMYLPAAVRMSSLYVIDSSGMIGLLLTSVYSLLVGVSVSVLYMQLSMKDFSSIHESLAYIPGLVVSGCAGCGAGLLGLTGFAGALALLPFNGNLVRLGGILMMIFLLGRTGNPRKCEI